jgi:hypothetical protein
MGIWILIKRSNQIISSTRSLNISSSISGFSLTKERAVVSFKKKRKKKERAVVQTMVLQKGLLERFSKQRFRQVSKSC